MTVKTPLSKTEKKTPNEQECTLKNSIVEPPNMVPYWISVCLTRSSALFIGVSIFSTVRNAARFAVYDDIMIRVKNHHTDPTILPENDLQTKAGGFVRHDPSRKQPTRLIKGHDPRFGVSHHTGALDGAVTVRGLGCHVHFTST